jgi:hypothetical protein
LNFDILPEFLTINIAEGRFLGQVNILLKRFKGHNLEKHRHEGFLCFGHPRLLNQLTKQPIIAGDGIHQVAPPPFQQLYIIGFIWKRDNINKFVPCIYILMTHKTEFLYNHLFGWLATHNPNTPYLEWVTYICDFEYGAINAVIRNVPDDRPDLDNLLPHGIQIKINTNDIYSNIYIIYI